ncbi:siroheme synthase [Colletotrichum fioriniae PJ7]|uniref:precorrin-2 dehydrogenase n=1 Tax=Colletotrichum fioriniae PJ7 TaxID=1445577 RepID=A0A010R088_9PEZI|nr:siroheme synthase [Colletotrichum fioriniae PJ7]
MAAKSTTKKFPEVKGGGSLILAWQIKGKKVLVVGGGELELHLAPEMTLTSCHAIAMALHWRMLIACLEQVAAGRILNCLDADANVTVVCPASGLNPEVAHRVEQAQVTHVDRLFEPSDLDGAAMVLVAIDDPAASTVIWKLCKERKVPANIADVPPECDFYFGSVHRDGPLQIMVSTNGKGPRLAAIIRRHIAKSLPKNAGNAIEAIGTLRAKLRKMAPNSEESPKRMGWMIKVSNKFDWEEICDLTDEDMENLLRFYATNEVPTIDDLLAMRENPGFNKLDVFDGSFGFCVGA